MDSPQGGTGFELPVRGCDESGFRPFVSSTRQLSKDLDGVARAVGFITDQTVNGKMPPDDPKIGIP